MAIEYSGWIEVPHGEDGSGGTSRIPFVFQSDRILESRERNEELLRLYNEWTSVIIDSDPTRQAYFGQPIRHRFTSVIDTGYQNLPQGEPHFGR